MKTELTIQNYNLQLTFNLNLNLKALYGLYGDLVISLYILSDEHFK